jgi:hypothetical protein
MKETYYPDVKSLDEYLINSYGTKNGKTLIFYPGYTVDYNADVVEWSGGPNHCNSNANLSLDSGNNCKILKESVTLKSCSCQQDKQTRTIYSDVIIPYDITKKIYKKYDTVVLTRIIEHIPLKEYLYLFYQLSEICNINGYLIITYPDMNSIIDVLNNTNIKTDYLKYFLYNIEMFNEGEYHDLHKTFTNKHVIEQMGTYENLFQLVTTSHLFSISNDRKVYRTSIFIRKTVDNNNT